MNTSIGGDRIGSGNKMDLSFKNYERNRRLVCMEGYRTGCIDYEHR